MALDPIRFPFARLVDPSHRMPHAGRWFGDNAEHPGFERVDVQDGHTHFLLAHKSIELVDEATVRAAVPPSLPPAGEGRGEGAPAA